MNYIIFYLNLFFLFCDGMLTSVGAVQHDFCWKDYTDDVPHDAVEASKDRYIGQINFKGYLPATIYSHSGIAIAEFAGRRITRRNIKILCSPEPSRFYWDPVNFTTSIHTQMNDAVRGGYQENLDDTLFIGQALHEGEWKVGKVVPIENTAVKGLYIWDQNGNSVRLYQFGLLKYNATIPRVDIRSQ